MARHLADATDEEWRELIDELVGWLQRHNIAGSIAAQYSLYRALDDEREKAVNTYTPN